MDEHPLTVVQMLPALESGGVERGTVDLSQELVRRGHRSIVISAGGRLVAELKRHQATHVNWPVGAKSPLTLRWLPALRNLLTEQQVDILHVRSRVPAWLGWLAWKSLPPATRPHFITTTHGLYSVNRYSEIMSRGERVIAISQTVQEYLRASYPRLDQSRVRLIYRGVDERTFSYGFRPSHEWLSAWYQQFPKLLGCPVITLPGRITRCKGHLELIELADQLRATIPNIQALIVGGIDERRRGYAEELEHNVRQRKLDNVHFIGHRSDIREVLAVSDVVLSLTSDPPEAFGRTTAEALSIGIPVVGYDHGGTGEILKQVFPAGLVPQGNQAELLNTVSHVLTSRPQVPPTDLFRRDRMIEQTLAVYREVA